MEEKEPEIEYLQPRGEALSIKTRKQGRRASLSKLKSDTETLIICNETGVLKPRKVANGDMSRFKKVKLTAHTILNHKFSSDKEKEVARKVIEKDFISLGDSSIIYAIAKRLRHM